MAKLFITGVTGYIGGDALFAIATAHPDLEITALVRNSDKGAKVASQFSKVRLVYGDLDSTDLLIEEASKAEVVVHTANCDHVGSAHALIAGLSKRQSGTGYLIHTSGTGILTFRDSEIDVYGETSTKVYDDWDGIKEVTSLPDVAIHRDVDKIILAASKAHPGKISTAIVCPPCISGPGRGPDNRKSMQAYWMAREVLKRGKGFQVGAGKNIWAEVNVQDLSNVFLGLVTAALSPSGGKATWNDEGYYFAEDGDIVWGEVAQTIAKIAYDKKLIKTTELDSLGKEEVIQLLKPGPRLWGTNSRGRAIRARKVLDWTPKGKKLSELLSDIVELEAKEQGLIKGHAAEVAG
ncbi:NAD(P)-binding protein [Aaosphaeria arxii CBS 175.79]|uniref:NAD(P)-binding protein n=1 Tax=Aaosphaeria arxii CBS 175.79 TaxID=1450172 RepID=A0A6A5XGW0_9PLEO|nr:NAD(P)-binding protein [Aaosphaeria arxii CBS 175.79]KAF2012475.1 NAD(P)-binding protein [Aaosphaeria arxii CBS 175.79]